MTISIYYVSNITVSVSIGITNYDVKTKIDNR